MSSRIMNLDPDKQYYYQVDSKKNGLVKSSSIRSFKTKCIAPIFNNISNLTNDSVTLNWQNVSGALFYLLTIKKDGVVVQDYDEKLIVVTTIDVSELEQGVAYEVYLSYETVSNISMVALLGFSTEDNPPLPISTDGLLAFYNFNGNSNDSSGNDFHGTLYNAATIDNNILNLPSNESLAAYMRIDPAVLNTSNDWSISLWCKIDTSSGNNNILSANWGYYGTYRFDITFIYGTTLAIGNPSFASYYSFASPQADLDWHHITFTKEGVILKCYIDTSLKGTVTLSSSNAMNTLSIADMIIGSKASFIWTGYTDWNIIKGKIDNLAFYNKAITVEENTQLYNYGFNDLFLDKIYLTQIIAGKSQIMRSNMDGTDLVNLSSGSLTENNGYDEYYPIVSDDRLNLAFTRNNQIFVTDSNYSTTPVQITSSGGGATFNSNGTWFDNDYLIINASSISELIKIKKDGTGVFTLMQYRWGFPSLSPDKLSMAVKRTYDTDSGGFYVIALSNANNAAFADYSIQQYGNFQFNWGSDGYIYHCKVDGGHNIISTEQSGGGDATYTSGYLDSLPRFNNNKIYFLREISGIKYIYVKNKSDALGVVGTQLIQADFFNIK